MVVRHSGYRRLRDISDACPVQTLLEVIRRSIRISLEIENSSVNSTKNKTSV